MTLEDIKKKRDGVVDYSAGQEIGPGDSFYTFVNAEHVDWLINEVERLQKREAMNTSKLRSLLNGDTGRIMKVAAKRCIEIAESGYLQNDVESASFYNAGRSDTAIAIRKEFKLDGG